MAKHFLRFIEGLFLNFYTKDIVILILSTIIYIHIVISLFQPGAESDSSIDGEPMPVEEGGEDLDGVPMDDEEDLDGVPMPEEDEDIDGMPMDEEPMKSAGPEMDDRFVTSSWSTVSLSVY